MPTKQASFWMLMIVIYFLVHALIRTSFNWFVTDEELALLNRAAHLAWLYDGQMPLYMWLQNGVLHGLGETILALTLLKNGMMLLLCLAVFTMVERVASVPLAFAATASLLLLPHLAWTSQHSHDAAVLATLLAAVSFLSLSRLTEQTSLMRYALLGAMLGLGAISAVGFLLIPLAMVPAAFTTGLYRRVLWNPRVAVTLVIALAIAFRPYQELLASGAAVLPGLPGENGLGVHLILGRASDLYTALHTVLAFTSLLIVAIALAIYSGSGKPEPLGTAVLALRELMIRTVAIGIIIVFMLAMARGAHWINQAQLQPLLYLAAPACALYFVPKMSQTGVRKASRCAGVIAGIILLLTPAHYSFQEPPTAVDQQAALVGGR